MSAQVKYLQIVSFHLINSGCCGTEFMMSDAMYEYQKSVMGKGGWYCPGCGKGRIFTGKTKEDELEEEVAALKRGKDLAERQAQAERENVQYQKRCVAAQKGARTRLINRIKNGICPCCNRTITQLARHMKTKHPEYVIEKDLKEAITKSKIVKIKK